MYKLNKKLGNYYTGKKRINERKNITIFYSKAKPEYNINSIQCLYIKS